MSKNDTLRSLEDGQIDIFDGTAGTPLTHTVSCDEGNFQWQESKQWRVNRCRGQLVAGGVRPGPIQECTLSVTTSWTQLIQHSVLNTDPIAFYEFVNGLDPTYTSVDAGHYALKWVFTVVAPGENVDGNDETITFAKVRTDNLTCAEGDERNTLQFSGIDNEERPTIARIPASP